MSLRICKCCGEPVAEKGDALSRNPNICASCSCLSDEMPESAMAGFPDLNDKLLAEEDFPHVTAEAMLWEHMRKVATVSH